MSVPTMKFIFCFASSPLPFLSSFLLSFHFHPLFLLFFQYFIPFNIYWNTAMCWTPWVWLGIQKCPLPVGGTHWPLAIHFNHEIWNFLVSFFPNTSLAHVLSPVLPMGMADLCQSAGCIWLGLSCLISLEITNS